MGLIKDVRSDVAALDSSRTELRKFGWTMAGVAFVFLSLGVWKRWNVITLVCLAATVLFFGLSPLFMSSVLHSIRRVWMAMAFAIGWVVSRVILVLLFYGIVTPIALIAKLTGKKFLDMERDPNAVTYWLKKKTRTSYNKLY
jgi:hypothetical protein